MTKILLKAAAFSLAASVVFTGCGSKEAEVPEDSFTSEYVNPEFKGAPAWVMNPYVEGAISAMGSAPANAGNDFSFQREEATANARDNMARQISVKVQNMFKSFKQATGSGTDATFDKASSQVSKQIASQTLNGTRVHKTWISSSNTMYVLVVLDTENVTQAMDKQVRTSFKNDKAMYQQFLAAKAQGELDMALEKAGMQ